MANGKKTAEDGLRAAIAALEALTERQTFVLVRPFDHLLPDQVQEELVRVLERPAPAETELDIVLESDGGDADAAYKTALVIRAWCGDARILVPSWAKSAATLFALCGDRISMPPAIAELGPLDAQVTDPRNPARSMSALDGYQSVEYIRDYALQTQHLAVMQMLDRTKARVPLGEILDHASAFANDVVSPIIAQVRPLDFGGWGRTLDIGQDYAERLLGRFNMLDSDLDPHKAAHSLVYDYPHHGFVIDLEEATALGFVTEEMPRDVYLATSEVVAAAFMCRQIVCDEQQGHTAAPGYTGLSPEKTTKKRKEVKRNGTGDTDDGQTVRDLRRHPVGQEQEAADGP
jgi:hypothetical protein